MCFDRKLLASAALNVVQHGAFEFGGDVSAATTLINNTGVTLESGTLDYSRLLFDVANLDFNVARFDTDTDGVVEFVDNNLIAQLSPYLGFSILSTGDVGTDWTGIIGVDGIVDIEDRSGFGDPWSNSLDMDTRLILGNFIVEDPSTGTIVPIQLSSSETITDFASADEGGLAGLKFTADGFAYAVQAPVEPSILIREESGSLIIEFSGILQSSETLGGWTDLDPQPASPYTHNPSESTPTRFFRARN
jgi:hypothetical protein